MKFKKEFVIGVLVLIFVAPVLAADTPGMLWSNTVYGSVTDIDFDYLMNNIIVSDMSGNITDYSNDGDIKWTYNFSAPYYALKTIIMQNGAKILTMSNSTKSGNITYIDSTSGTEQWNVTYNTTWGDVSGIDMDQYGSKILAIYDNKTTLFDSAGNNIGNITKVDDCNWSGGTITKDGDDYIALIQKENNAVYLYKHGYSVTWVNDNHTVQKFSNRAHSRIITVPDNVTELQCPFSLTTDESKENLPLLIYSASGGCNISDFDLTEIPSTIEYNAVSGLYNVYCDGIYNYDSALLFYG